MLNAEGVDSSDCVERADLQERAFAHILGDVAVWDPAPDISLLPASKRPRADTETLRHHAQSSNVVETAVPALDTHSRTQPPVAPVPPATPVDLVRPREYADA